MPTVLPTRRIPPNGSDRTILIVFVMVLALMGLALAETAFTDTSAAAGGDGNPFCEITFE